MSLHSGTCRQRTQTRIDQEALQREMARLEIQLIALLIELNTPIEFQFAVAGLTQRIQTVIAIFNRRLTLQAEVVGYGKLHLVLWQELMRKRQTMRPQFKTQFARTSLLHRLLHPSLHICHENGRPGQTESIHLHAVGISIHSNVQCNRRFWYCLHPFLFQVAIRHPFKVLYRQIATQVQLRSTSFSLHQRRPFQQGITIQVRLIRIQYKITQSHLVVIHIESPRQILQSQATPFVERQMLQARR
ncbi:hypothetical protein EVA_15131 [gut metagenome]|uniref:Uncharacterized protein n=1 Tax=gut metagenome TaxID=749906 RepID=J9FPA1_9ZZZZ